MRSDGYWGNILRINLYSRTYNIEIFNEDDRKKFVGGSGIGSKIILEEVPPKVDPLSEKNKIVFGVGPWQSLKTPGSAKWSVVTKSPLTKTFLDSAGSGHWASLFKRTGFDALIIEGKSDHPIYIYISHEGVFFKDAKHLWGKDTVETAKIIKKELNNRVSVLSIGPSGEICNPIACIACDGHSFAGRGGSGAVLGSKKLKAIAVYGEKEVPVYNYEVASKKALELMKKLSKEAKSNGMTKHGTPGYPPVAESIGDLPIKYWNGEKWTGAKKIGGEVYTEKLNATPLYCANCPVGCHRHVIVKEPKEFAMEGAGPEYETLALMGGSFLCSDLYAIAKANDICNRMGIDTMSTGAFVSFLAECWEKDLISRKDTDNINVSWGNGESLVKLTEKIAKLEGVGNIFRNGIRGAAKIIGKNSENFIVEVKNLDYPGHDPRCFLAMGVNYATSTRGACHERGDPSGVFYPELGMSEAPNSIDNAAEYAYIAQNISSFYNQLVICKFMIKTVGMTLTELREIFNNITGWDWDYSDMVDTGKRVFTIQRTINVLDGISKKDDTLPSKIKKAAKEGPRKGKAPVPHKKILNEYYKLRKWDSNGIPTKSAFSEVGIEKYWKYIKDNLY